MSDTVYVKPNAQLWRKVNKVLMREGAFMGETLVTFIGAMAQMLIQAGVAHDESAARAYLAAMVLSPEGRIGELRDLLDEALAKLAAEGVQA